MRSLFFLLVFLLCSSQAHAFRGGPFDSSSNQSGVDARRGSFQTVIRGKNVIGYCFYSTSSNLESYGTSRLYIRGVSCIGAGNGIVETDANIVIFQFTGQTQQRIISGAGFLDLKVDQSHFPYSASGKGEMEFRDSEIERAADPGDSPVIASSEDVKLRVRGNTRQTSLLPSLLFMTITDQDGNQNGPIAIDPTDAEGFVSILNSLRGNK